jgi:soluble lytic murein transglycosylase-like protein
MKPLSFKLCSDKEVEIKRKLRERGIKDAMEGCGFVSRGLGGEMKKVIAIIFLIPALVLVGRGEGSTPGIFTLANLITIESEAVDVPVELVYAVILTESSGNPLAKSEADCRGLMQVSEEVWNIFMKGKSWHLAYSPEENVRCGIRYLGDLYKMYVSWEKVLRHYHSGNPNSNRAVTERYVKKVLKRADMMSGDRRWVKRKDYDHRNS